MKTMTQSDITLLVQAKPGKPVQIEFKEKVIVTLKPKYMDPYDIVCTGLVASEQESGRSRVLVSYELNGTPNYFVNWSQLNNESKNKIQEQLKG